MPSKFRTLSIAAATVIPLTGATIEFFDVLLKPHHRWYMAMFPAFSVLVFLGAASLLLMKRPHDRRARVAAVLSAFVGMMMILPEDPGVLERLAKGPATPQLWLNSFLAMLTVGVVVTMLLHLALIFPQPAPFSRRVRPLLLYVVPLLGAIALPLEVVVQTGFGISTAATMSVLALQVAYGLAVPIVMWRQYRRSSFEEKRQIRWPIFGIGVAVLLGVLVPTLSMWKITLGQGPGRNEIQVGFAAVATPLVMIPVTFLIAIFKYRLLDIDVIIRKTVTYTIVTLSLLLLYAGGVTAASRLLASRGITDETTRLVTTAVVAALFVPVRDRVQRRIDARFYRRKYDDIESVRLLDEAIASATDLQSLLSEATARLQQIFVCRAAAILVREPRSSTLTISSAIGLHEEAIRSAHLDEDSSASRSICNLDLHPDQNPDEEAVRAMRARLLVPVRGHGELAAVIALGAKMSDEIYDSRDERVAAALADRLAAAIENFRFRQLTAAESEWRTLDRISRLAFVAIAQQSGDTTMERVVADVRTAADAAGLHTRDERIEIAVARLVDYGAIERSADGRVVVTRRNWLALPDVLRPLELGPAMPGSAWAPTRSSTALAAAAWARSIAPRTFTTDRLPR